MSRASTLARQALAPIRLPSTVQQVVEYVLGAVLAYFGLHVQGASSVAVFGAAVGIVGAAALSPGVLGWGRAFGPRGHRIADACLGVGCLVAVVLVTRATLLATIPLVVVAAVLLRLASGGAPPKRARKPAGPRPDLSAVARATGTLVGRRSSKPRP